MSLLTRDISAELLARDPLRGALVENFMITELMKHRENAGFESNCYFYRDSNHWTLECARINLAYLTGESPVVEGSRSHHVASLGAP